MRPGVHVRAHVRAVRTYGHMPRSGGTSRLGSSGVSCRTTCWTWSPSAPPGAAPGCTTSPLWTLRTLDDALVDRLVDEEQPVLRQHEVLVDQAADVVDDLDPVVGVAAVERLQ